MSDRPAGDPDAALAALRAQGGDRADPVRFRFLEALARRSAAYRGDARRLLDTRLARAVADYTAAAAAARTDADALLARQSERFPEAAAELAALHASGDFGALRQCAARLDARRRSGALAGLVAQLDAAPEMAADAAPATGGDDPGSAGEGDPLTYFENIWTELKVEQQLAEALAQAPENAGPLNSHLLALQALKLMRDVSPDYLKRFVSYVDALLWLDQADQAARPAAKGAGRAKAPEKKRRSPRGKAG